jgi:hypothetical protein
VRREIGKRLALRKKQTEKYDSQPKDGKAVGAGANIEITTTAQTDYRDQLGLLPNPLVAKDTVN